MFKDRARNLGIKPPPQLIPPYKFDGTNGLLPNKTGSISSCN